MKKNLVLFASLAVVALSSCNTTPKEDYSWIKKGIDVASAQLKLTAEEIADSTKMPRSIWTGYDMNFLCQQLERDSLTFKDSLRTHPQAYKLGKRRLCGLLDWTSGFFPGTLWYTYELTGDNALKTQAVKYTNMLNPVRYYTGTHDLGFMINCSYGNAKRLSPNDTISAVMVETAENLCSRFNEPIGAIRSWDFGTWNFPVIIDNMMNLELMFEATRLSGDSSFYKIAVSHADRTMEEHFRPDGSCYHVIDYSIKDGKVRHRQTAQGYADESIWSRGQAWAIYGYAVCYRETKDRKYLDQALKTFTMMKNLKNMPEDLIPYWDMSAPNIPNEPRDVSTASCIASALYEISTMDVPDAAGYKMYADSIMVSLSSPAYRAALGTNGNFLLMHSVGSIPHNSEIDVPLNYADYYYLEALKRKRDIEKGL